MALAPDIRRTSSGQEPNARSTNAGQWTRWYLPRVLALDFLVALIAGLVAFIVRFGADAFPDTKSYILLTAALPFVWVAALGSAGAHKPRLLGVGSEEFRRICNAGVYLFAGMAIASYATQAQLSRAYVLIALPLATVIGVGARYALRKDLHRLRKQGKCMHRTVAVGHSTAVADLGVQLRRERHHGMELAGVCLPSDQSLPPKLEDLPVLGDFDGVSDAVEKAEADTVTVLTCPEMNSTALRRLAWRLEKTDTELVVAPGLVDVAGPRTTIRPIAGLPLLHIEHPELSGWRRMIKDIFDRVAAGLGFAFISPLFALIALAVRLTSPGPAFFRQTRVAKDGREFTVLKFRTMWADADAMKANLAARNDTDGVLFKMRRDPRVTPLGATLRRYSLDELPQLINVVRGQMSLVGPRPPLPEEVEQYGDDVRRRLVVKPGLTGLWQISGRSDLSWEESVRLDLRYVENWSFALDVVILWKTLSAVIKTSGAY